MSRHKQKPRPLTRSGFSTIRRLLTLTSLRFASAMMLIHKPGVLLKKYGFSCVRAIRVRVGQSTAHTVSSSSVFGKLGSSPRNLRYAPFQEPHDSKELTM